MRNELVQLADGWAGTAQTVERMARLAREGMQSPSVVEEARDIVRFTPERDTEAEIRAVSKYVRTHVKYQREGLETLAAPWYIVKQIREKGRAVGDCDEFSTLWASLHRILGHRVRFVVVSLRPDGVASHVYGEVFSPRRGKWIPDDTIAKRFPLGWSIPKGVTAKRYYNIEGEEMMGNDRGQIIVQRGNQAIVYGGLGIIPLIVAGVTVAATVGAGVMQAQAAKKAKKQQEKMQKKAVEENKRQERVAREAEAEANKAAAGFAAGPISAVTGGGSFGGIESKWIPYLAIGGAALVGLAFLGGKK